MSELFDQIDSLRQAEGKAALATLVSTHGTTPRKEGAKMWVGRGGPDPRLGDDRRAAWTPR